MAPSFLWYDLETQGLRARDHPIVQFGAIRTDENLNLVDEPLQIFCRPPVDMLPSPESVLVHQISASQWSGAGRDDVLSEAQFSQALYKQVTTPGTCSVGYNSVSFDNEFLRFLFFRNFLPSYVHEYANDCSKWDFINVLRLVSVVEPDAFKLPLKPSTDNNLLPSYRLSDLAEENDIKIKPHDALEDVQALHALAQRVKQRAPEVFDFCFNNRQKRSFVHACGAPFLYFSSFFHKRHHSGSIIYPLVSTSEKGDELLCLDLRYSPEHLLTLSPEEACSRFFTKHEDLAQKNIPPVGFIAIRLNRCPALYPFNPSLPTQEELYSRLDLQQRNIKQHLDIIEKHQEVLCEKVRAMHALITKQKSTRLHTEPGGAFYPRAERNLYSAGFISNQDAQKSALLQQGNAEALKKDASLFDDARLREIFPRYKARNFPNMLTDAERALWESHLQKVREADLPQVQEEISQELEKLPNQGGEKERALLQELSAHLKKTLGS